MILVRDLYGDMSRDVQVDLRVWPCPGRQPGTVELVGRALSIPREESSTRKVFGLQLAAEPIEQGYLKSDYPIMGILDQGQATMLMDSLWQAGIRPSEQGSAGQLAAVERHLRDMRKIAFATLDITAPEIREKTLP